MTGYIALGVYEDNTETFISNTGPILWTNKVKKAKVYLDIDTITHDLEYNLQTLLKTLENTNLKEIYIVDYKNDIEISRKLFIC